MLSIKTIMRGENKMNVEHQTPTNGGAGWKRVEGGGGAFPRYDCRRGEVKITHYYTAVL